MRWGVLGAADIAARAVVPAILATGGEVVALGCRDPERGRRMAAGLGISPWVGSYREALEQDLEAVYIPLPNSLHRSWTLSALGLGHPVLCEKPLAMTSAEAEEMGAAARDARLVLAEAVMYRYHPRWATGLELLREGRLGEPLAILGSFGFRLRAEGDIRWLPELGGGALYDVGSYLINASRWLAGREPQSAVASGVDRGGVDLSTTWLLDFPAVPGSSPTALAATCSFGSVESEWLRVIGSEASLLVPRPFTSGLADDPSLFLETASGRVPERVACTAADPYREMVGAFQRSVQEGTSVATSAEDGAATLRVIEACQRSRGSHGWEEVSPPPA